MDSGRCGSCTLCCRLTSVPELRKPIGAWCRFCTVGEGCRVYEVRPPSCKTFECVWYANPGMPDALRPDRCKVVFEGIGNKVILALINVGSDLQVWRNVAVRKQVQEFLKDGNAVVDTHLKRIMLPKGRMLEEVKAHIVKFAESAGVLRKVENGSAIVHDGPDSNQPS